MDRLFSSTYKGDPGIPRSGRARFENMWIGSVLFSVYTWFDPYMWQTTNRYNWHDHAMLYEQYQWKKAMEKKQPYIPEWNKKPRYSRESYYFNWPYYFP